MGKDLGVSGVSEGLSERVVGSSGEVALWRAVIDQLLHDATSGATDPDEAREFFWASNPDLELVCNLADLDPSALCRYSEDVIRNGRRRRLQRRIVS